MKLKTILRKSKASWKTAGFTGKTVRWDIISCNYFVNRHTK